MSPRCWTILGIEPVEDKSAIRKAYAAKLKGIDPESDPQAFVALREALDEALDWLRWGQFDAQEESFAALEADNGAPAASEPPTAELPPAPAANPWQPEDAASAPPRVDDRALDELEALLFGGDPDSFPDAALLQAVVRRILSDPAMAQVDQAEGIGQWLANVIGAAIPRSDPVVGLVAEHFGWTSETTRWDRNPNIDYIVARHQGLSLLDRLADPKHDWHEAYLELTSDASELGWNWGLSKRAVKTLLEHIRAMAPEAERGLNAYRVSLWEDKLYGSREEGYSGFAFSGWTIAIIAIFAVIRIFVAGGNSTSNRPPPPPPPPPPPTYAPEQRYVPSYVPEVRVIEKDELERQDKREPEEERLP